MDRGAWWATVHGAAKSRTQLTPPLFSIIFSGQILKIQHELVLLSFREECISLKFFYCKKVLKYTSKIITWGIFHGLSFPNFHIYRSLPNPVLFIFFFFVVNFVIHWNEKALSLHVFPIPIPPPTCLPTRSLQVLPEHQVRALVSCIQPGPVIYYHYSKFFFR